MMRTDFDWMKEVQDFSTRLKNYFENFDRTGHHQSSAFSPAADVYQSGDAYYVEVELPGMSKEDIRITMAGGVLEISGDKRSTRPEGARTTVNGRSFGQFTKRIQIPAEAAVDLGGSSASYENGVLVIKLPKRAAAAGTSIPVN